MKKIILGLSIALISAPVLANPSNTNNPAPAFKAPAYTQNQAPRYAPNAPRAPSYNRGFNRSGSSWNMPNMNWGNNRNGSGFNNGFNNGSSWNMPSMNWGSGNGRGFNNGSNWNMPNMNWGSNRNGSNWNMPGMNWGNNRNGSNWNMPNFNMGSNNPPGYWNPGQNYNSYVQPNRARPNMAPPRMPVAPRPQLNNLKGQIPATKAPTAQMKTAPQAPKMEMNNSIPKPSDVKGVILAPENKAKAAADTSKK